MRDTTHLLENNGGKGGTNSRIDDDTSTQLSSALSIDTNKMSNYPNKRKMEKLKKQRCRKNACQILWVFLGIFLFFGSIQILWAPTYLENIVHDGIIEAFIFTEPRPEDENYMKWVSNDQGDESIPIKVYINFFNITNPDDLTNGELPIEQRLPKFHLTPPIVYTQYYYRENISFSDDGTMSRSYFKTMFYHDPELSEIEEDDVFTIIAPLVSGGSHFYEKNGNPEGALNEFLYNGFFQWLDGDINNLFSTATARDLIFSILNAKFPVNDTQFGPFTIPAGSVVDFTYGMLKNGSGSWYISHTGYGDEGRMGEVIKWSNQAQNWEYTPSDPVLLNFDDLNFTFIDCWYPHLPYSPSHFIYQGVWSVMDDPENSLPPFFVSTLKKPLIFDYYKPVKYKGIPAEQYNVSVGQQFMNDSLYPPNAQYFQFGTSGVLNMTHCFNDLPLFFSLPKFYGAPDFAINNSKMSIPEPTGEDNGFLQVEPMTGAILNANVALQGNVPINPLPDYGINITVDNPSFVHLPSDIMAPTYLLRYEAHLPEEGAKDLSAQIALANDLDAGFYIFGYICIGLSVLYYGYSCYWFGKNGKKSMFPGLCCNDSLKQQIHDAQY